MATPAPKLECSTMETGAPRPKMRDAEVQGRSQKDDDMWYDAIPPPNSLAAPSRPFHVVKLHESLPTRDAAPKQPSPSITSSLAFAGRSRNLSSSPSFTADQSDSGSSPCSISPSSSSQDSPSDSSPPEKRGITSKPSQFALESRDVVMADNESASEGTGDRAQKVREEWDMFHRFTNASPGYDDYPDPFHTPAPPLAPLLGTHIGQTTDDSNGFMAQNTNFAAASDSVGHLVPQHLASDGAGQETLPEPSVGGFSQSLFELSLDSWLTDPEGQSSGNGHATTETSQAPPLFHGIGDQSLSTVAPFGAIGQETLTGSDFLRDPMLSGSSPHPGAWSHLTNEANLAFSPDNNTENLFSLFPPPEQPSQVTPAGTSPHAAIKPKLTICHAGKSRVETQLPIKMTLDPMPAGVTKLRLPTHAVSKPKLMANPAPQRSPEMLDLDAMLVCTSAMRDPVKLRQALTRAATSSPHQRLDQARPSSSSDEIWAEDDPRKPLNGGDVIICDRCVKRERKRSCRKRTKDTDEEELWARDELMRVIVFNTQEVKEWQQVATDNTEDAPKDPIGFQPSQAAMQITLPMRITCYCRHHLERIGYRVIFTLKDHNNTVVAQSITDSIMITDDHKLTQMPPPLTMPRPSSAEPPAKAAGMQPTSSDGHQVTGTLMDTYSMLSQDGDFQGATSAVDSLQGPTMQTSFSGPAPVRLSHSSSDLESLRNTYVSPFMPMTSSSPPQDTSQATSTSATPRNLSRQASFSGPSGPAAKKRKSHSSARVPEGLTMTRIDTLAAQTAYIATPPETSRPTTSSGPSPYTANIGAGQLPPTPTSRARRPHFSTGPPTPSGSSRGGFFPPEQGPMFPDNMTMQQAFSAPTSARHSRTHSPMGYPRANPSAMQQAQMTQAVTDGLYGSPSSSSSQPPPSIHKSIPGEGPKTGGVEVCIIGNGFYQGLEVMFGENLATTTTFWNDRLLVCLLPASTCVGEVLIRFKHDRQPQQIPTQGSSSTPRLVTFRYTDNDEEQLLKLALSVIGHKITGRVEDAADVARKILANEPNVWRPSTGGSTSTGTYTQQAGSGLIDKGGGGLLDKGGGLTDQGGGVIDKGGGSIDKGSGFVDKGGGLIDKGGGFVDKRSCDLEATLLRCLDIVDFDESPHPPYLDLAHPSGQTMLHLGCSLGLSRFVAGLLARGVDPTVPDKGGFTPIHFAAMHNWSKIVRRLLLSGADPTVRTLKGFTPADVTSSEEVLQTIGNPENYPRKPGTYSERIKDRVESASSLRSLWEGSVLNGPRSRHVAPIGGLRGDGWDEDGDGGLSMDKTPLEQRPWTSRRNSRESQLEAPSCELEANLRVQETGGDGISATAIAAWRNHIADQLYQLQQAVQLNLPNLPQIPTLLPMPNLPDYHSYLSNPMVRLGSLVPNRVPAWSREILSEVGGGRDGEHHWWGLLTGSSPPPAYEEIYPPLKGQSGDPNKLPETIIHQKHASVPDQASSAQSSAVVWQARPLGALEGVTRRFFTVQEQREQKMTRSPKEIRSVRKLFSIWIPLLVVILVAMVISYDAGSRGRIAQMTSLLRGST